MRHKSIMLLLTLGFVVFSSTLSIANQGDFIAEKIGPALPEAIVSVYIPPTRAESPFVATENKVFQYQPKQDSWREFFVAPKQGIRTIAGYAKSSKVLYVVHAGGVSSTRNGGKDWKNNLPRGFLLSEDSLVWLSVNPTNRKQVVLAIGNRAWSSQDYGRNWNALALPSGVETLTGLGYTGGRNPQLVATTNQAVYLTRQSGRFWTALMRHPKGPQLLAVGNAHALAFVLDQENTLRGFDLSRPGYRLDRKLLRTEGLIQAIVSDYEGRGLVWLANENVLRVLNLQDESASGLLKGSEPIMNLTAHPREAGVVIWSEGNQLFQTSLPDSGSVQLPTQVLTAEHFTQPSDEDIQTITSEQPIEDIADDVLDRLLADQPPLEEAIASALQYASYRPGEVDRWKDDVRRRNLLPRLTLKAGTRQTSLDDFNTSRDVNRFGEINTNDIRQPDNVESLNSYSVELRWDLRDLIFDQDQISLSEEARERATERNALITQISRLYFDRLEALLELKLKRENLPASVRMALQLRLKESTALLNNICGEHIFE